MLEEAVERIAVLCLLMTDKECIGDMALKGILGKVTLFDFIMSRQDTTGYNFFKVDFKKFREKVDILEGTVTHDDGL